MKKYILVTASSKGLGLEIAKKLSFDGYNIILTSRSNKNLKQAKSELNQKLKHKLIKINFSKDKLDKKLIEKIKNLNIIAVVHNYGTKIKNDSHPVNSNILLKNINNNFLVSLKINNKLFQNKNDKLKKIIYIGSTASLHAKASPSYTLSKSLINTYVKNSAQYYIEKNISICAVLPGILGHIGSEWERKKDIDAKRYTDTKNSQPLKRFSMPSEIASYISAIMQIDNQLISGSVIKLDANDY